LTLLLLDKLKASPSARIINVSSEIHRVGKIDFDDLNLDKDYTPFKSYAQSKLANVLFTRELAKRLKGTNVKAFSLSPGHVETEATRYMKESQNQLFFNLFDRLSSPIKLSPFLGSQTTLYCVLEESIASESGSYYNNCSKQKLYRRSVDEEDAAKLWQVSCDLVGLKNDS
jgi:NAD(P)-dependent dehydrogenase (short-subunit alcohol dehydrogenase family)